MRATIPALLVPAYAALDRVGLKDRADFEVANLSHGEHRLLELAMALANKPRLLLLDEPMAGLGPEESARMVAMLRELKRDFPILLVEHDMEAVFALADRITVLVYGRVIASGDPESIRANAEVRDAYLGEKDEEYADG
jgi:branched-chain amino acid transport system ATP-binding protein